MDSRTGLSPSQVRALSELRSIQWFAKDIHCPVFIQVGVLDVINPADATIRFLEELEVPKKLYLGSGGHGAKGDKQDLARLAKLKERWLAHWLKDIDTGILEEPEVYYGLRPSWRPEAVPSFPPREGLEVRRYHLSPATDARPGTLEPLPGRPSRIKIANRLLQPGLDRDTAALLDQKEVEGAVSRDVHVFETVPLNEPLTLLGSPRLHLAVDSRSEAWQVYAALYDVPPGGEAELVTMAPFGKMEGGAGTSQVEFELRSMAFRFGKGHRLRLELSNHGEPIFVPYFEDFSLEVTSGRERPSWIEIPIAGE